MLNYITEHNLLMAIFNGHWHIEITDFIYKIHKYFMLYCLLYSRFILLLLLLLLLLLFINFVVL